MKRLDGRVKVRPTALYLRPDVLAILDEMARLERRSRSEMARECILRIWAMREGKEGL
jgi:predicted transcriptional regulator